MLNATQPGNEKERKGSRAAGSIRNADGTWIGVIAFQYIRPRCFDKISSVILEEKKI